MIITINNANEGMDRLIDLIREYGYQLTLHGQLMPRSRCAAHGIERCLDCSRIEAQFFKDGERTQCSTYGSDGMHWDTCRARLRGPVYANIDEARRGAK